MADVKLVQRFCERFVCPRVGHRHVPWAEPSITGLDVPTLVCTRCDVLLRPSPIAHADFQGAFGRHPNGEWELMGPEPLWVGHKLRIAQCACGRQFTNRDAYMWHWHVENRREGDGGR